MRNPVRALRYLVLSGIVAACAPKAAPLPVPDAGPAADGEQASADTGYASETAASGDDAVDSEAIDVAVDSGTPLEPGDGVTPTDPVPPVPAATCSGSKPYAPPGASPGSCPADCSDGDPCTVDVCHPWAGCLHTADAQQPGCPCPWWGHAFIGASSVTLAQPMDDGRTLVGLTLPSGVTHVVLGADGTAEPPLPLPADALAVWPRKCGWGALIATKDVKLVGYDPNGKVVWKTTGLTKQYTDIFGGMCPLLQFAPKTLTFGDGKVWVTGPSSFSSSPSLSCWDGGPSHYGWLAFDDAGNVVNNNQFTLVSGPGESKWVRISMPGTPLVLEFYGDGETTLKLGSTAGPPAHGTSLRRGWEGGVVYMAAKGQFSGGPVTRLVPSKGVVWTSEVYFEAVGEWPDGSLVGYKGSNWAALPAAGTATSLVDLPAGLVADVATPAWQGGFIVRGKLNEQPWVGFVALRPGKPLVCK